MSTEQTEPSARREPRRRIAVTTPTPSGAPGAGDRQAVCDTIRSLTDAWGRGDAAKAQSYTLVRQGDRSWRIAAFHNTQRRRVMERISFVWDPSTAPEAEK
ncbi:hypothetical protein [Kitasatospora sp. NPDC051914]|uniref:hypothetical protein n=1 Tax=Kitasatospora sp. NPDC051914 TaxID=3154945 RepID=UPI00341DFC9F